ncbi:hypothetical protein ACVGVM_24995 [Pseudonocardia bannensis]|uniref:hypothetical protein n=1 Tax=Pseudonocardia bannensis TaxID=630973 RepID=UPI001FE957C4|nr:hypothetical protein [Pseudonocardia bannensis]
MAELPDRVRRKIDEIFGDVLPTVTRDELGEPGNSGDGAAPSDEEWLRANRPPHHDRD